MPINSVPVTIIMFTQYLETETDSTFKEGGYFSFLSCVLIMTVKFDEQTLSLYLFYKLAIVWNISDFKRIYRNAHYFLFHINLVQTKLKKKNFYEQLP